MCTRCSNYSHPFFKYDYPLLWSTTVQVYIGTYEVRKFILFGVTTTDRKPLATPARIELALSSVTGWRFNQLNYGAILAKI